MKNIKEVRIAVLLLLFSTGLFAQNKIVVFQSDFGLRDGAVSAMKGVATTVDNSLKLYDLTHEIPPFNIWDAAYRLNQTIPYWSPGTVFVSVVDPGVGSDRKSVVVKTKTGQYIVTPDNGTLTLIAENVGIAERREINEQVNRRKGSEESYTFHGRDVYAYTAARLAAGLITFEQVGNKLTNDVVMIPHEQASYSKGIISGSIDALDVQYGNVWSNIPSALLKQADIKLGDVLRVRIFKNNEIIYDQTMPYVNTFSGTAEGSPLVYLNSLLRVAVGLNMGNFAGQYHISSGKGWRMEVSKK